MGKFFEILLMLTPLWILLLVFAFAYYQANSLLPKITFKNFKKFYELNPKRWRCETDYVQCRIDKEYNYEAFNFSFIDECKYRIWRRKRAKHNVNQKRNKSIQRMMDAVKEDIASAKKNEMDEMQNLIDDLKQLNTMAELPSLAELLKKYGAE